MTNQSTAYDIDVLVVGGGPTGLVMACELAARGVRCRVVDKAPERSDKSRALVVHARSLELFQKMGIVDALLERGQRGGGLRAFVEKRPAFALDLSDVTIPDTPYPFPLFVSQAETEHLLDEHLLRLGLSVERPVELLGFEQDDQGVIARLRHAGEGGREEVVRARYIVGCDGAHSVVRKGAGLSFEGAPYEQEFILADLDVDWQNEHDSFFMFLSKRGMLAMFPMRNGRRYRLIASRAGVMATDAGEPTVAEFEVITRAMSPFAMKLENPVWLARFRLHHRGVDRYRKGRAFVAGDAAHIHSPAGGQGMNTGIQDAYNLAWKMALVIKGRAEDALLDSYHDERHPVGKALLTTTDRMFSFAASQNALFVRARNFLAPRLVPRLLGTRERRARAFRFLLQLGIKYSKSPIVGERREETRPWFRRGPRAGDRAPDAPLALVCDRKQTTLFERTRGPFHALVLFEGRSVKEWAAPLARVSEALSGYLGMVEPHIVVGGDLFDAAAPTHVYADPSGVAHDRYGLVGAGVYLLRPDGYIAFRSEGMSLEPVVEYLKGLYKAE